MDQLKAAWTRDKEAEIKQRVESGVASERAAWEEELRQVRLPPSSRTHALTHGSDVASRTHSRFPAPLQAQQTWELRVEEARRCRQGEMVEAACQGDVSVCSSSSSSRPVISEEELQSRLAAQKLQLQQEAESLRQKAVEESRKHVQRELHKKHLEDMAKQVS